MSKEYWIAAAILACETSRMCYNHKIVDQFAEPQKLTSEEHHRLYLLKIFQENLDALKIKSDQFNLL